MDPHLLIYVVDVSLCGVLRDVEFRGNLGGCDACEQFAEDFSFARGEAELEYGLGLRAALCMVVRRGEALALVGCFEHRLLLTSFHRHAASAAEKNRTPSNGLSRRTASSPGTRKLMSQRNTYIT